MTHNDKTMVILSLLGISIISFLAWQQIEKFFNF